MTRDLILFLGHVYLQFLCDMALYMQALPKVLHFHPAQIKEHRAKWADDAHCALQALGLGIISSNPQNKYDKENTVREPSFHATPSLVLY